MYKQKRMKNIYNKNYSYNPPSELTISVEKFIITGSVINR